MKKIGKQTFILDNPAYILGTASIVGPKESNGPLQQYFDKCIEDEFWGEKTWEKAESKFIREASSLALSNADVSESDVDCIFAGDLLNQCIASTFGLRDFGVPFFGTFGACSTFVESLILGSVFIDSNAVKNVLCATSSHFCGAEKQFRFPLELGNQRPQSSQWTVTGSGACVLGNSSHQDVPRITAVTPGIITDLGVKDASNMGAAMMPSALSTLKAHFEDLQISPDYYDLIITGDLGYVGKDMLIEQAGNYGFDLTHNYNDTGVLMFDKDKQDTHAGGSGCACVATVFSGYIYKMLKEKQIRRLLLMATGALMNATSSQQGESIPGICHAVQIEI